MANSRRKSNKAGGKKGKWKAMKIGYSHVLHLREVTSDCRTFGTCPADTSQVKGRARRVIPSNREGTLSRRTPPRKHTGSSAGSNDEEEKMGLPDGEKGGTNAFRTQRPSPPPHRSRTFWKFHEIRADQGSFLFARDALHFYDETKVMRRGCSAETFEIFTCGTRNRMELDPPWARYPSVEHPVDIFGRWYNRRMSAA